ncbi:MAG: peptidase M20, partial [Bacillota bacterium]|nr:peptidase M20 [Bacillota bacterium]
MGYIEEFLEFLSIPSVGTMPEFKQDTLRAAEWLRQRMAQAGIQGTRILASKGQPTVYGKVEAKTPGAPT